MFWFWGLGLAVQGFKGLGFWSLDFGVWECRGYGFSQGFGVAV